MKLNPLLVTAALAYAVIGMALTFAPAESLAAVQAPTPEVSVWLAQLLGAAILGLTALNYVHRYSVVGGILGRPILLANLVFLSGAFFASVSSWRDAGGTVYLAASIVLGLLFAAFGVRLFTRIGSPKVTSDGTAA